MPEDRPAFEPEPTGDETQPAPLPARLVDDLAGAAHRRIYVPEAVDQAVLAAAEAHLGHVRQRRRWRWLAAGGTGLAAAAALALGVSLWLADPATQPTPAPPAPQVAARLPEDIDGNGIVDVRDAFAVARRLKQTDAEPPAAWDVNGDGRIDQRDVDAIAQRAVRLNGEHG